MEALGNCVVVAQDLPEDYVLVLVEKGGWPATSKDLPNILRSNRIPLEDQLPVISIYKGGDVLLYFSWLSLHIHPEIIEWKTPTKKVYVLDREEQAELEQAKKTAKESARIRSSKWAHQRHEAARAILGVRKGRW